MNRGRSYTVRSHRPLLRRPNKIKKSRKKIINRRRSVHKVETYSKETKLLTLIKSDTRKHEKRSKYSLIIHARKEEVNMVTQYWYRRYADDSDYIRYSHLIETEMSQIINQFADWINYTSEEYEKSRETFGYGLGLSDDGRRLITQKTPKIWNGSEIEIIEWDLSHNTQIRCWEVRSSFEVLGYKCDLLALKDKSNDIYLWDMRTDRQRAYITPPYLLDLKSITFFSFDKQGERAIMIWDRCLIAVWSVKKEMFVCEPRLFILISCACCIGDLLLTSNHHYIGPRISAWNMNERSEAIMESDQENEEMFCINHDQSLIAAWTARNGSCLYGFEYHRFQRIVIRRSMDLEIAGLIDVEGTWVCFGCGMIENMLITGDIDRITGTVIQFYDLNTLKCVISKKVDVYASKARLTPDGTRLLLLIEPKDVRLLDVSRFV